MLCWFLLESKEATMYTILSGKHNEATHNPKDPLDHGPTGSFINAVLTKRHYHIVRGTGVKIVPDDASRGTSYAVPEGTMFTQLFLTLGWIDEDLNVK